MLGYIYLIYSLYFNRVVELNSACLNPKNWKLNRLRNYNKLDRKKTYILILTKKTLDSSQTPLKNTKTFSPRSESKENQHESAQGHRKNRENKYVFLVKMSYLSSVKSRVFPWNRVFVKLLFTSCVQPTKSQMRVTQATEINIIDCDKHKLSEIHNASRLRIQKHH